MELIIGILGGGAVGAGIMTLIQMCVKRKWDKEDKEAAKTDELAGIKTSLSSIDARLKTATDDLAHVKSANKAILEDRIKWLGEKYLSEQEIDFEDRRILHNLHNAYHNDCGGNGDYDCLMRDIDELPLKHG